MARDFDGAAGYLQVADGDPFGGLGNWTAGGWVNLDSAGDSGAGIVVHGYSGGALPIMLFIGTTGGGTVGNWTAGYYNTGFYVASDSIAAPLSRWVHMVGRVNTTTGGSTVTLFRDGVTVAVATPGAFPAAITGQPLYVGRRWDGNGIPYLNGRLQDVRVYDSFMSDEEVFAWYSGSGSRRLRAPLAHWPMEGYSGERDKTGKYPLTLGSSSVLLAPDSLPFGGDDGGIVTVPFAIPDERTISGFQYLQPLGSNY